MGTPLGRTLDAAWEAFEASGGLEETRERLALAGVDPANEWAVKALRIALGCGVVIGAEMARASAKSTNLRP